MSSGFVSENVLEEARKKRQEEWDKVSDQHPRKLNRIQQIE